MQLGENAAGAGELQGVCIDVVEGEKAGQQVSERKVEHRHRAAVEYDIYIDRQHALALLDGQRYDAPVVLDPHLAQAHPARHLGGRGADPEHPQQGDNHRSNSILRTA